MIPSPKKRRIYKYNHTCPHCNFTASRPYRLTAHLASCRKVQEDVKLDSQDDIKEEKQEIKQVYFVDIDIDDDFSEDVESTGSTETASEDESDVEFDQPEYENGSEEMKCDKDEVDFEMSKLPKRRSLSNWRPFISETESLLFFWAQGHEVSEAALIELLQVNSNHIFHFLDTTFTRLLYLWSGSRRQDPKGAKSVFTKNQGVYYP